MILVRLPLTWLCRHRPWNCRSIRWPGVNLSLIRQEYGIPEGFEPQTAIAIGYPDTSQPVGELAEELEQEGKWTPANERLSVSKYFRKMG